MQIFHYVVDHIPQNPIVYIGVFIFAHKPCVTSCRPNTREIPLKWRPNHHRISEPTGRSVEARIYHNCVELAIFVRKDIMRQKFTFQTHRMIKVVDKQIVPWMWRRSNKMLCLLLNVARALPRPGMGQQRYYHRDNVDCSCSRFML